VLVDIVTAKRLSLTDILRASVKKKQNKTKIKGIVFRANESGYRVLYKYTSNYCHDFHRFICHLLALTLTVPILRLT